MTDGRVVIVGGHGFVGSALREGLTAERIVAPTRAEVDLADVESIRAALLPGDVVVNAAGYADATDRSPAGVERFRRDNVHAVRNLADSAIGAGAARLIHLSSVAAMGQRSGRDLSEEDLATPRSPYGQSKRDAELILDERRGDLPITILRPTSIFGPGRGLAAILCRIAALPVIPLPDGGRALIPFSPVANLVAAVDATIGTTATDGRTFIVGDDRSYALREVVLGLATAMGRAHPRPVPVPAVALTGIGAVESLLARLRGAPPLLDPIRIETLTVSISYSTAAFRATTGFVPPVVLPDALAGLAEWHRTRRAPAGVSRA